ncbi:MAG: hypothetical protein K940chlam7_02059 [Chlamydiae bacterium]|nr:hypothetical protein [Chlamydiota bacterium]
MALPIGVPEAKENLPRIYNELIRELTDYRTSRVKPSFFGRTVRNPGLTQCRLNLADKLIRFLSSRQIGYIKAKTGSEMQNIGSMQISSIYLKILDQLSKTLEENDRLTSQYGTEAGELNTIIVSYQDKIDSTTPVLAEYFAGQEPGKEFRSMIRLIVDKVLAFFS